MWTVLRRDPGQFFELAVLYTVPQLTPEVNWWHQTWPSRYQGESTEQLTRRVTRESTRTAAYGGAVIGSSFYVGMVPATAMIYCDQLVTILRIAALFGYDVDDPARAAEILVIQGRYPTIAAAGEGLVRATAGPEKAIRPGRLSRFRTALRELLAMIGLQLGRFRSPVEVIVTIAEVLAYLIPIVSIPVWMAANMRTTKRLARDAVRFYQQEPLTENDRAAIMLPALAAPHRRGRFIGALALATAILVGLGLVILPRGYLAHHLPFGGVVLAEAVLVWTFVRLLQLTRPTRRGRVVRR